MGYLISSSARLCYLCCWQLSIKIRIGVWQSWFAVAQFCVSQHKKPMLKNIEESSDFSPPNVRKFRIKTFPSMYHCYYYRTNSCSVLQPVWHTRLCTVFKAQCQQYIDTKAFMMWCLDNTGIWLQTHMSYKVSCVFRNFLTWGKCVVFYLKKEKKKIIQRD